MNETKLNNISISNYIRWDKFESSEQFYKHHYNLETTPLCQYCDDYAEYESFNKGYKKYCNYYKHADVIRKEALVKRKITLDTISHNIINYDDFIFKNINFYLSNDYPKIDIFDNNYLRSISKVRNKSSTNLKFFDIDIKCICCNIDIKYNVFNYNKLYCNNKSCSNTIRYNEEFIDMVLLYNFNIHQYSIFKRTNTLNLDFHQINELFNKYGFEITKMIISGFCIEYNEHLLYRQFLKYDFSFLKNNIKDDKMIRICKCCNKEYIYKDLYITNNKNYYEKIIGAEYSCKNKKCYHNILTLCLYDRDMSEQSRKLKEKIFNGSFTPNITNSWANSKTFLKMYNKNFRSTWEAYFYLYMNYNNIKIEYEKLRIKYYDSIQKKERNYITDFIDETNKILYEIKPYCHLSNQNVIDKEEYTKQWCIQNDYTYTFITEEWFKINYNFNIVLNSDIDEIYKQKIKKALNFKKDKNI